MKTIAFLITIWSDVTAANGVNAIATEIQLESRHTSVAECQADAKSATWFANPVLGGRIGRIDCVEVEG